MTSKDVRVPSEPGSRERSQSPFSPPDGFDPSRIRRPGFEERLRTFSDALFRNRMIAERIVAGQQFNCYERATDEDEDEHREFMLCVGPIGSAMWICDIEGKDQADLIEAAMKVATEAFWEAARDSDGSPKGGDAKQGSVEDDSAAIAQSSSETPSDA